MLRRVTLLRTEVSEELEASIFMVTRIGELGKTLAVTSNRRTLFPSVCVSVLVIGYDDNNKKYYYLVLTVLDQLQVEHAYKMTKTNTRTRLDGEQWKKLNRFGLYKYKQTLLKLSVDLCMSRAAEVQRGEGAETGILENVTFATRTRSKAVSKWRVNI
jgi:hypothetical protein